MQTDVLIIGSGPVGATYARLISEQAPQATILMVDAGPRLTQQAGQHTKNIVDGAARDAAQVRSQGNHQSPYPLTTVHERAAAAQSGTLSIELLARAGVHLVAETVADLSQSGMPAAALSTNVGGMGAHWTCACPSLGNGEKIPFLTDTELAAYYQKARALLHVTQHAFPDSPEALAILNVLGDLFNPILSSDRQVDRMPLACQTDASGARYWTGPDVILGELADQAYTGNFTLRSDTICRQLLHINGPGHDRHVTGAIVEHLPTNQPEQIDAKIVIVAADALRTPQLLWASHIRPKALGHYLNEHPFIFSFAELKEEFIDKSLASAYNPAGRTEPTVGVFWVPFDAPNHPFHGQVMHMDVSPLKIETHGNPRHIVGLGWGALKEMRYEDCVVFSETETDYLGMPKMAFQYQLTEQDLMTIAGAKAAQAKALTAFGKVIQEGEQTLMPPGSSLHYEGTTRMGVTDDGTSVCDTYSQVWGFDNLFVGGNGVIPIATTSNPTLTSIAMSIRAFERVLEQLAK
ncbi:GMC oxidoreductase [Spirosoma areae]